MLFDIYRKIETEEWSDGVLECWNAGLGDCTAETLGWAELDITQPAISSFALVKPAVSLFRFS